MAKKRLTDAAPGAAHADDAAVFRAAVYDVKPLSAAQIALGASKHKAQAAGKGDAGVVKAYAEANAEANAEGSARVRRKKALAPFHDDIEGLMPLIATSENGEAASIDDAVAGGAALSFQRAGVRTQVMRRLRRGLYPTQDELDLHGLTQTGARDQLAEFIIRSRDSGHRCVRIIHGKGYRSGARGPVLKTAVNLWLRRHLDVIAFVSAKAIDGGTGAVYVLLRG
jgi:DNA-nicking Smr family endonuclease